MRFHTPDASKGGKVQNLNAFDEAVQLQLKGIGGEPLAGSGFEGEPPEPEFAADLREEE